MAVLEDLLVDEIWSRWPYQNTKKISTLKKSQEKLDILISVQWKAEQ